MLLAVRISSYGCTWEVWRALKKLELLSAAPRATLTLLSCSPNFPRASITRCTHAKHEPILKCKTLFFLLLYVAVVKVFLIVEEKRHFKFCHNILETISVTRKNALEGLTVSR